jgi:hypothetical protein
MNRWLACAAGALLPSLACGGETVGDRDAPVSSGSLGSHSDTAAGSSPAVPEAAPALPGEGQLGQGAASNVETACPVPSPRTPDTASPPENGNPVAYARFLIMDILAHDCSNCHARTDANAPPGALQFGNDPYAIAELGLIVPLRSDLSPLIQVMRDGSMPPPCVQPRPPEGDMLVLSQFIDNPRFWPDTEAPPAGVDAGVVALPADAGIDGGR